MVIEWLTFRVAPEAREKFVRIDSQIYSTGMAKYPGYLGKEVWINPGQPSEVILVLRWKTREQWKAVPIKAVEALEQQFLAAMGDDPYELIEEREFQVRKFPG